jgi:hypothetical protein
MSAEVASSAHAAHDDDQVVIVAAGKAWPMYQDCGGYACQHGRTFRGARWMGFYSGRRIHGVVARVLHIVDSIDLTDAEAAPRLLDVRPLERRIGQIIRSGRVNGQPPTPPHQLLVLSCHDDPLSVPIGVIEHHGHAAWTMNQRYQRLGDLRRATTTEDLP